MTLFAPDVRDSQVATVFGTAICAALAMSAGIGGGGLFVPLLILMLHKSVSIATSMSQCLIAGAAIAGIMYNLQQRHPSRDRPLIDVSLVLFLAPLQMAGALLGNVLNRMLPSVTLIILMVIVLSVSDVKTVVKGWQLWKKESSWQRNVYRNKPTISVKESNEGNSISDPFWDPENVSKSPQRRMFRRWAEYVFSRGDELLNNYYLRPCFEPYFKNRDDRDVEIELMPLTLTGRNQNVKKQAIFMDKESRHNRRYWLALGVVWMITLMLIFVRGGKGADSIFGVPFCGAAYWCVSAIAILVLSAVSMSMLRRLVNESKEKLLCGYQFAEGDVV